MTIKSSIHTQNSWLKCAPVLKGLRSTASLTWAQFARPYIPCTIANLIEAEFRVRQKAVDRMKQLPHLLVDAAISVLHKKRGGEKRVGSVPP